MSDFCDDEILTTYAEQTQKQIIDLNRTIVALSTKIAVLEKNLAEKERLPVPRTVINQVLEMERKIRKLEDDLKYYKNFVPTQVIINRENKEKPTRKGGLR